MHQSTKMLLQSAGFLFAGLSFAWMWAWMWDDIVTVTPINYLFLLVIIISLSISLHSFGVFRGWWKLEMRNSSKHLIKSGIALVMGVLVAWIFYSIHLEPDDLPVLFMMVLLFYGCGHYHGAARGWVEVENRRQHPSWYEGEKLKDS